LGVSAQLEFRRTLSDWLSLDVRGLYLYETHEDSGTYQESYYSYYSYYSWYSGWHYVPYRQTRTVYWDESYTYKTMLGDASLCANPWRGKMFDPFIGIGVRHARIDVEGEYSEGSHYHDVDWDDSKTTLLLRIGALLNVGRFSVKGEYLHSTDKEVGPKGELIGSVGLLITQDCQFLVFTDYFMWEEDKSCHVGGGVSLNF
jgi:hypothetical protein